MKNKLFTLCALTISLLIVPTSVLAAPTARSGNEAVLNQDEVISQDYFAAGEVVVVSGTVEGDAYVAGSTVRIDGTIKGDLFAAGKSVIIEGDVLGDLRTAGEQVTVSGLIGGNITAGSQTLTISDRASVQGSILAGAAEAIIQAPVGKDLTMGVGSLILSDKVGGDLTYWSDKEVVITQQGSVVGSSTRHDTAPNKEEQRKEAKNASKAFSGLALMSTLSFLALALILTKLAPVYMQDVSKIMGTQPMASFGRAVLIFLAMPFAIVLLFVTIIGIPFAFIVIMMFILLCVASSILAAYYLGDLTLNLLKLQHNQYGSAAAGVALTTLLTFIPVVGWLVKFVIFLIAFGSLISHKHQLYRSLRTKKLI